MNDKMKPVVNGDSAPLAPFFCDGSKGAPVVIIIDDDNAVREYLKFILEREGMKVFEAVDGNNGLNIATATPPSLIITDLIMPEKDGIETIQEIRNRFPQCGVIAMSGAVNSDAYLSMARLLGANSVVQKPFTRDILMNAVRETVAEKNHPAKKQNRLNKNRTGPTL